MKTVLSRRLASIAPFHVMEFVKEAQRLEALGHDVIHLSIGEPDFKAVDAVQRALHEAVDLGRTGYTPALGIPELRAAIAGFQSVTLNAPVDPSRIMVTAGASAALQLVFQAILNPGDEVLLADPAYPCNANFIRAADGVPKLLACGPEQRFQLQAEQVAQAWGPRTRAVLVASPGNPTGTSITWEALEQLYQTVQARGGTLIVDEIYLGLSDAQERRSAAALGPDVIVINSFSKYFAMTGWRLGWLVLPAHWIGDFERLAGNLFICASALSQYAALGCFTADSLLEHERRREAFRSRRAAMAAALPQLGFEVPVEPDGAFYVYARCTRHGPSDALAHKILAEAHVCVVPGLDFGPAWAQDYLRFSCATSQSRIDEALHRIQRLLG